MESFCFLIEYLYGSCLAILMFIWSEVITYAFPQVCTLKTFTHLLGKPNKCVKVFVQPTNTWDTIGTRMANNEHHENQVVQM
jgi:hypothetical protein